MEIRIKTGKLTNNLATHNTYAPDSNYEFGEINEHWGPANNFIFTIHKNLIKCWYDDNNGPPENTEDTKNFIGKWTL